MSETLTRKLLREHLAGGGAAEPGSPVALRIDQTLTQDATGTLVMLELEALELDRVRTEVSVQYVDHNLLQADHKNPDDHAFLLSGARRFGLWYSGPGNGVSHPVHQERFGRPGATLLGADSHTCAAGAIGMLAIGAGGLEVALAMAGERFHLRTPAVHGVRLEGELPPFVSAKDVILELLRRHGVSGAYGRVLEYHGPGLAGLSAMDRHVIANMGAELGATSSVFPSDGETRRFLEAHGRGDQWVELGADPGARYEHEDVIELPALEPLIARPSSPGDVVPVRELAGAPIHQAYLGSSANPGYRDFAVAARMLDGRRVAEGVSFDVNPASRQVLVDLVRDGHVSALLAAGARLHQTGCNGCIGMGQAPATGKLSVRTVPRNFPGRSGTRDDRVYLASPETVTACALTGAITDPRELGLPAPRVVEPREHVPLEGLFVPPLPPDEARGIELERGPNIAPLPELEALPDELAARVLLEVGNDVSTDEILPAGARVLPFRSNIERIADFAFEGIDETYPRRARAEPGGHAVVGGDNYGQGSSREHAALAPRHLGLRVVLARSFARIHGQNLVNFGVLPLVIDAQARGGLSRGDRLVLRGIRSALARDREVLVTNETRGTRLAARHELSPRQVEVLLAGGIVNWMRRRLTLEDVTA